MARILLASLALLVAACNPSGIPAQPDPAATPVPRPTRTPRPADTGWQPISAGLEAREQDVARDAYRDRLYLARIDPARATIRIAYSPGDPRRVGEWLASGQARLVING